jgi:hypothetical protein
MLINGWRILKGLLGEDFKQDIPISSIGKNKKKLDVELKTDVKNDIFKADTPDEFLSVLIILQILTITIIVKLNQYLLKNKMMLPL